MHTHALLGEAVDGGQALEAEHVALVVGAESVPAVRRGFEAQCAVVELAGGVILHRAAARACPRLPKIGKGTRASQSGAVLRIDSGATQRSSEMAHGVVTARRERDGTMLVVHVAIRAPRAGCHKASSGACSVDVGIAHLAVHLDLHIDPLTELMRCGGVRERGAGRNGQTDRQTRDHKTHTHTHT
jgi:hypothetical protein